MEVEVWRCDQRSADGALYRSTETLTELGPNEVLVLHKAIGINFMDVYFKKGIYPNPGGRLGCEASGIVEAVGAAVVQFGKGDRVAYASGPNGSYSQGRIIDARHLVRLPDDIEFTTAAAILLKGMTAGMLSTRLTNVKGRTVLFHAAAGGVGLLAGQWLAQVGAKAIGVAGNCTKAAIAREHGYHHVIDRAREDVTEEVKKITSGSGVQIVFDGVGRATFQTSLECASTRGWIVRFGAASGPVEGLSVSTLAPKALFLTRPTLTAYTAQRDDLVHLSEDLFRLVRGGAITHTASIYRFGDVPDVHAALEDGRTTGSLVVEV